jgi:hypothetical protein
MVKSGKGKSGPKNAPPKLPTDVVVKDTILADQENDIDSDSPIGGGSNNRVVGPGPGVATPNFKTWYLRIKTRGLVVLET